MPQTLSHIYPFSLLPENLLEELSNSLTSRNYQPGEYIFREKEPARNGLFLVFNGILEIVVTSERGQDLVIALRRPGEFFGETVLFSGEPYPAGIRAATEALIGFIPKNIFMEILNKNLPFTAAFNKILTDRLRDLYLEISRESQTDSYSPLNIIKKASQLMNPEVVKATPGESIKTIANLMAQHQVSSVVIVDNYNRPLGIITEHDLVRKVLAESKTPTDSLIALDIMNKNPATISPDAYYSQILLEMIKKQVRHLLVTENETLLGIITLKDLLKSRETGTITIVNSLETASSPKEIKQGLKDAEGVLTALVSEKAGIAEIYKIMTEFFDRAYRKAVELALTEMEKESGPPPADFCFINMGSAGREEQYLRTDLDNGLIWDNPQEEPKIVQDYFLKLGQKINNLLIEVGFSPCKGGVMASNPFWNGQIVHWEQKLLDWFLNLTGENIRLFSIFLDFRPVYGNFNLAEKLKEQVLEQLSQTPIVFFHLARDEYLNKVPLNVWHSFITPRSGPRKDMLDLKRQGTIHFVDAIRLFALREKYYSSSATLTRLKFLETKQIFSQEEIENFQFAFETISLFRIKENLSKIKVNLTPTNLINPYHLPRKDQMLLKEALIYAQKLQQLTATAFRVTAF
ncbi:DUF294 nucleotidyltransferase-like domain-containing protein [Carboxydothermus hydrogenoformans]|uniref:CBS/cyclic nucleotide-binding domain protein n=1 Tax=Carboxydothermus hydrogenoformans (strain ATCC BAA-161 / DSM 6008 / Z-2901) TaxID=246194 RepID=Q3AAI0_CARHZ|nr:DUF294 nucleotidyltransferase-like domain-containing protein [Carboxydothermus hydrogenoformans]ABB14303.1 CBS/cyclic nucleotide-binding domain protein [Carboxydothermus hydrogenoformans Z-2901]